MDDSVHTRAQALESVFDARTYGPLGFKPADGPGVCFSPYEVGLYLQRMYSYRRSNQDSVRRRKASTGTRRMKQYLYYYRDGSKCKYCRCEMSYKSATLDHYYPPSLWGEYDDTPGIAKPWNKLNNLVLACHQCNFFKGRKSPETFIVWPRDNLSWNIRVLRWYKRRKTKIRLVLNGTHHILYGHKGFDNYEQNRRKIRQRWMRLPRKLLAMCKQLLGNAT